MLCFPLSVKKIRDIYKLKGEELLDIYLKSVFQHLPSVCTQGEEILHENDSRSGSVCASPLKGYFLFWQLQCHQEM